MNAQDKPLGPRKPEPRRRSSAEEPAVAAAAPAPPMVVGIGASAGGLEAYKAFFDHMPADNDMAFVLVQHLAPDHASLLVDLIARHTQLPVVEATDGLQVEARHVYIIPPDVTLTIADGVLQLSKPASPRQYRQRKQAARQRELLVSELNHRVKNMLATVQAIALQTMAGSQDMPMFRDAFMSRLHALAKTHDLLSKVSWRAVGLRDVVEAELAPYSLAGGTPPDIEGDALQLTPRTAVALSLALHELATNAGKYGALSSPAGRVQVRWRTEQRAGQRWLSLHWAEQDGPAVAPPKRNGFGSRLIREGIAHELGGRVSLDFPVTGVVCTIELPLVDPEA